MGRALGVRRGHDEAPEVREATRATRSAATRAGPTTDEAMTLSEEEVRVGTTERESGRVRLKKYIVEDEVTKTVPSVAKRFGSNASRSRTPTAATPSRARPSPRRSK